ncbi:hypothetical protein IFVP182_C260340 [Vibrio parahaemolyticus]
MNRGDGYDVKNSVDLCNFGVACWLPTKKPRRDDTCNSLGRCM